MFTIGEISALVKITPRMLRYYEKTGVIIPAEIDKNTGYRYYSGEQIPLLFQISYLRDTGFQIREILDYIDSTGAKEKNVLISDQVEKNQSEILEKQNQSAMLKAYLERLQDGNTSFTCEEVVVKQEANLMGVTLRKELNNYHEQSGL